jgi:murein L,D-transpeptidase YcbB/YkuD
MVEEIEKNATKVEFNTIEISGIDDTGAPRHKPQFQLLLDLAIQIEASHQKEAPRPQQQRDTTVQTYTKNQRPQPTKEINEEISAFAQKLDVKDAKQPIESFNLKQENAPGSLLDSLSVSDQISELERIIEGLHEQSFDYDKIEAIKRDIYDLNKEVISEIMKGTKKKAGKTEQDLIRLRDQRLNEAMALLK